MQVLSSDSGRPTDDVSGARQSAIERFGEFLSEQGLKFTPERRQVVEEFFKLDRRVEAEELLRHLRGAGSGVSRATIYRTLDLIVQAALGRKVRLGTDHYYFEHVLRRRQHEHMICTSCGSVLEWYDPRLERVIRANLEQQQFAATRYALQVFGRCQDCASDET